MLCPDVDPAEINTIKEANKALATSATEPVGFLQFFNSRHTSPVIHELVKDSVLAKAASRLLGCKRIRLYQVSPTHNPAAASSCYDCAATAESMDAGASCAVQTNRATPGHPTLTTCRTASL